MTVTALHEPDTKVTITQKQEELKTVGVGALVWEGALVLSQVRISLHRGWFEDRAFPPPA